MRINLTNYRLHLVLCPVDMRRGFTSETPSLTAIRSFNCNVTLHAKAIGTIEGIHHCHATFECVVLRQL